MRRRVLVAFFPPPVFPLLAAMLLHLSCPTPLPRRAPSMLDLLDTLMRASRMLAQSLQ
jgi:hypothetical protein